MKRIIIIFFAVLLAVRLLALPTDTDTGTATITDTNTPSITASPTSTQSDTNTPSITASPTPTQSDTNTPSITASPTISQTSTISPTFDRSLTRTQTPTATLTSTPWLDYAYGTSYLSAAFITWSAEVMDSPVGAYQLWEKDSASSAFVLTQTVDSSALSATISIHCGVSVTVKVVAVDDYGFSSPDSVTQEVSVPCAPDFSTLNIFSSTPSDATVTLKAVTPSAMYQPLSVFYGFTNVSGSADPIANTYSASLGVTTLPLTLFPNQSYWIRGYAAALGVTVAASEDIAIMPPPQLFPPVAYHNSVYLSWPSVTATSDVVPEVTGYMVYFDNITPTTSSFAGVSVHANTVDRNGIVGVTITGGIAANTFYYFDVATVGGNSGKGYEGGLSAPVTVTTGFMTPPIFFVEQTQGGSLAISWTAIVLSGPGDTLTASYSLYSSVSPSLVPNTFLTSTSAALGVTISPIATPGVNYYFVVVSSTGDTSPYPPTLEPGTFVAIPALAVPQPVATAVPSRVIINWPAVPGATEYAVLSSTSLALAVSTWAEVTVSGTSYVDLSAQNGELNYYTVLARQRFLPGDSAVESAPSITISAMPMIPPGEPGRYFNPALGPAFNGYPVGEDAFYLTATAIPDAVTGLADVRLCWAMALSGSAAISSYSIFRGADINSLEPLSVTPASSDITATTQSYTYRDLSLDASQSYTYGIVATDVNGLSGAELVGNTVPYQYLPGPASLAASVSHGRVNLSWVSPTAASGFISSYDLYRSVTPTSIGISITSALDSLFYQDDPPSDYNLYYYSVFSFDSNHILGLVPAVIGVTMTTMASEPSKPSQVTGLTATSVSGAVPSVLLQWTPNPSSDVVTQYAVYYNGITTAVALTTATSYLDQTNLSYGQSVSFAVQALRGSSATAGLAETTTAFTLLPPAPQDLSISVQADSNGDLSPGLQLLWADPGLSFGNFDNVYRWTSGPPPGSPYAPGISVNNFRDTAVSPGTTYFYAVTSKNGFESPFSPSVSMTAIALPPPPGSVTAVALTVGGQVLLNWPTLANSSRIWIFRNGVSITSQVQGLQINYVDANAESGFSYTYNIAGANYMGLGAQSPASPPVVSIPGPVSPSAAVAVSVSPQVLVTWNAIPAPADSDTYVVDVSNSPNFQGGVSNTVTSANFTDVSPTLGSMNYYSVTPYKFGATGTAGVSAVASVYVPELPTYPRRLVLTGLPGQQAVLSWEPAPSSQALTGYLVNYSIYTATSAAVNIANPAVALIISNTAQLSSNATSYVITTPTSAAVFVVASLTAENLVGTSQSAALAVTSDAAIGAPPPISFSAAVGFVEAQGNTTFARLSWNPPVDPAASGTAYAYVIYRSTTHFVATSVLSGGPADRPFYAQTVPADFSSGITTVADAIPLANVPYYYALTSLNTALGYGTGESSPVSSQPLKAIPYSYPGYVSMTAAEAGNNRVDFSWNPPSYLGTAPGLSPLPYLVYRISSATNPAPLNLSTTAVDPGFPIALSSTSYSDTQVLNGNYYNYFIGVVDSLGNTQTPPLDVSPLAPLTPIALRRPPNELEFIPGFQVVTISWLALGTEVSTDKYNVYRRVTSTVSGDTLDSTTYGGPLPYLNDVGPVASQFSTSVTGLVETLQDTNVTNKVMYCYTMSEVSLAGEGGKSVEQCVTPFQQVGPNSSYSALSLTVVPVGNTSTQAVEVGWYAGVNAPSSSGWDILEYQVLRSNNGGGTYTLLTIVASTAATTYSFTDKATTFGASYVYQVIPVDTMKNLGLSYQLATINIPGAFDNVSVFRNAFNPNLGESCPIQVSLINGAGGSVVVRIYTLEGQYVQTVYTDDRLPPVINIANPYLSPKFSWDGRNSAGQEVASGVYLIHLEASGVSYNARVAVIK